MKQAVILAAGEGQRLRPFTVTRPKVMLRIAGKPILQYVIDSLAQNGIRDIIIVVGYRKEQIFDYFGNGEDFGVRITYVIQDNQLGTAHALQQAKNVTGDKFLVLNGDNLIDIGTIANFISVTPPAILVKQIPDVGRYGIVSIEGSSVKEIIEKPSDTHDNLINTGIYAFTREIYNFIGEYLDIPDVVNAMLTQNQTINSVETPGTWLDVVYPWDIIRLNSSIINRIPAKTGGTIETGAILKGKVSIGKESIIKSNCYITGPVVIGENCVIGPNVCILPSTSIGDNVSISPFSVIEDSVIGDDVIIGSSSIIENSVIDKGSMLGSHFNACKAETEIKIDEEYHKVIVGAMIGIGCTLGNNSLAEPGVILGNYSHVEAMKIFRGKLDDRSKVY